MLEKSTYSFLIFPSNFVCKILFIFDCPILGYILCSQTVLFRPDIPQHKPTKNCNKKHYNLSSFYLGSYLRSLTASWQRSSPASSTTNHEPKSVPSGCSMFPRRISTGRAPASAWLRYKAGHHGFWIPWILDMDSGHV